MTPNLEIKPNVYAGRHHDYLGAASGIQLHHRNWLSQSFSRYLHFWVIIIITFYSLMRIFISFHWIMPKPSASINNRLCCGCYEDVNLSYEFLFGKHHNINYFKCFPKNMQYCWRWHLKRFCSQSLLSFYETKPFNTTHKYSVVTFCN